MFCKNLTYWFFNTYMWHVCKHVINRHSFKNKLPDILYSRTHKNKSKVHLSTEYYLMELGPNLKKILRVFWLKNSDKIQMVISKTILYLMTWNFTRSLYYTKRDFCQFSVHLAGMSWRYLMKRFLDLAWSECLIDINRLSRASI